MWNRLQMEPTYILQKKQEEKRWAKNENKLSVN